jgi:aminopeptidase N
MKRLIAYVPLISILIACAKRDFSENEAYYDNIEKEEIVDASSTLVFESDTEDKIKNVSTYHATETIVTDLIHTKLEVSFDWQKCYLNGIATITAKPYFYQADSLILDAKGMDILSVKMNAKDLSYNYDSSYLRIKLDRAYNRNESYTVSIQYTAKPNERKTSGSQAITSDKGLYFINPTGENKNVMPQIWTQGETEASSVWFPTIDAPNIKTSQEIYITVDAKYATLSNGKLVSSKVNSNGTRTDFWKQDLPHAPYLFMMAIGEFKVVKDTYTRLDGTKMDVNYYVEPKWEPYAKAIFGETPKMITFFSKLLNYEFPWDKYHQIVVRDYVSGAMENTGAVIFGDYVYKTSRELLDNNDQSTIAHELFHHWFGDLVTCESWSNLPLNESFANYSQYLWDEYRFGIDEADYQAGKEADGYYQSAQMQGYHDLIWFDYSDKEQMFDGHSYNKGGRILHMLRNYLGDDAFFSGMSQYLKENQFQPAEFHQLRLAFEKVSGEDLNWFFNQWFLSSGHPVLKVSQEFDSVNHLVKLHIQQNQDLELSPLYKLPVEIAIHDNSGITLHKIVIDEINETFEFTVNGNLNCVVFDNQQMLLAKITEVKPAEQYQYQYYNCNRYKTRKDALLFGTKGATLEAQKLIVDALSDPFWAIRLKAIEKCSKLTDENKNTALEKIRILAKEDQNSEVRKSAIAFIVYNSNNETIEPLLIERLTNDSSYLVLSACLSNLQEINPELAYQKANFLANENSSIMLSGIAQIYGSLGNIEDFNFFQSIFLQGKVIGFDEVGAMNAFTYFVMRNKYDVLQEAIDIFTYLKNNGSFYTKLFLPQNVNYILSSIDEHLIELEQEKKEIQKTGGATTIDQLTNQIDFLILMKTKYDNLID